MFFIKKSLFLPQHGMLTLLTASLKQTNNSFGSSLWPSFLQIPLVVLFNQNNIHQMHRDSRFKRTMSLSSNCEIQKFSKLNRSKRDAPTSYVCSTLSSRRLDVSSYTSYTFDCIQSVEHRTHSKPSVVCHDDVVGPSLLYNKKVSWWKFFAHSVSHSRVDEQPRWLQVKFANRPKWTRLILPLWQGNAAFAQRSDMFWVVWMCVSTQVAQILITSPVIDFNPFQWERERERARQPS